VKHDRVNTFLEVGIWLLFFALLVPAGLVGFAIGRSTAHPHATVGTRATADGSASQGKPWSRPNGDPFNTRATTGGRISAANVSKSRPDQARPHVHRPIRTSSAQIPQPIERSSDARRDAPSDR
jgi:hypothetical protein